MEDGFFFRPTTTATSSTIEFVGYDLLTPLLSLLFGETGLFSSISVAGVFDTLGFLWTIVVVVSYTITLLLVYLYIYAAVNVGKLLEIEDARVKAHEAAFQTNKQVSSEGVRFAVMQERVESMNPNDWKLAIIEADIILDDILKKRGYAGNSLGERLRSVSPSALASLDDAWQAHKVRNFIAHAGHEYVLTQKEAREALMKYERVFREFGVL